MATIPELFKFIPERQDTVVVDASIIIDRAANRILRNAESKGALLTPAMWTLLGKPPKKK